MADSRPVKIETSGPSRPVRGTGGINIPAPPRAHAPDVYSARVGAAAGLADLSRGIINAANAYERAEEENARAWSAQELSRTRLEWSQHMVERQQTWKPSDGTPFTGGLLADFDEYQEKAIAAAPNKASKKFLAERMVDFRTTLGAQAIGYEAQANVDYRMDQYKSGIGNSSKLMNTDPAQYEVALAEQVAIIDNAALPQKEKSALKQKAVDDISGAAVWSQIQRSPGAFLASIGYGAPGKDAKSRQSTGGALEGVTGNKASDNMPYDQRVKMFDGAIRLKAQIDMDAERATKANGATIANDAMKDAWDKMFSGKLRLDDVQRIKAVISESDYKSLREGLRKGLTEGGQKTDPKTYRDILTLEADGKYAEARTMAFAGHRNGLVSNEHLQGFVGRTRTEGRQEGPRSQYEQSRSYITLSMDPGPIVDPIGRSRLAEAIAAFDKYAGSGKRSDQELEVRGQEIVTQYKFVNLSETAAALPLPRSGNVRRNVADHAGMVEDIVKAHAAAKKKREDGAWSQGDYEGELALLKRWSKIADEMKKGQKSGK